MNFLSGKKTYIFALLGALTVLSAYLGYVDSDTANVVLGLLGFGGLASLRAAVKSS